MLLIRQGQVPTLHGCLPDCEELTRSCSFSAETGSSYCSFSPSAVQCRRMCGLIADPS